MRDRLDQDPKQGSGLASIRSPFTRFQRGSHVLVKDLRIRGVGIQEPSDRFGVDKQSFPPLFGLMLNSLLFGTTVQKNLQLACNGGGIGIANDFADVLQLPPSRLMVFRGEIAVKNQSIAQGLGVQLQPFKLAIWQFYKACTERLESMHVSFFGAFRGAVKALEARFVLI